MSKGFYQHPDNPSCLCFLDESEKVGVTYWIGSASDCPEKPGWWDWGLGEEIKKAKGELFKRKLGPMELIKWSS